jgi:transglutaminase-like putative cysteine protease
MMRGRTIAIALIVCLICGAIARAEPAELIATVKLVPVEYRHRLVEQLSLAEENKQQWLDTIAATPPEHREAIAFLLVNMPERDLKTLKGDYVLRNVELAYRAKSQFRWAIPKEIFLNDVLPYANLDEARDGWRPDYLARFGPLVKDCKSAAEAAQVLNREVFKLLHVSYHATKRLKPDQSPSESQKIGYASCTGLSIILCDACRAVGVPARVAGTPMWFDNSGNHTWAEVWDRQWYFVGAAEPGEWDQTWFTDNAARADEKDPMHRIYAASFAQTGTQFPLAWDPATKLVNAADVTGFYVGRRKLTVHAATGATVSVRLDGLLVAQASAEASSFVIAADRTYRVEAVGADGNVGESEQVRLPPDRDVTIDVPAAR